MYDFDICLKLAVCLKFATGSTTARRWCDAEHKTLYRRPNYSSTVPLQWSISVNYSCTVRKSESKCRHGEPFYSQSIWTYREMYLEKTKTDNIYKIKSCCLVVSELESCSGYETVLQIFSQLTTSTVAGISQKHRKTIPRTAGKCWIHYSTTLTP